MLYPLSYGGVLSEQVYSVCDYTSQHHIILIRHLMWNSEMMTSFLPAHPRARDQRQGVNRELHGADQRQILRSEKGRGDGEGQQHIAPARGDSGGNAVLGRAFAIQIKIQPKQYGHNRHG